MERSGIISADLYTFIKQLGLNDPGTRLSGDQVPIFEEEEMVMLSLLLPCPFPPVTCTHIQCSSKIVLLYVFLRP